MERFIEDKSNVLLVAFVNLKSSMERFIVVIASTCKSYVLRFKIQYGEIYRSCSNLLKIFSPYLKSSMERFIGKVKRTYCEVSQI